MVGCSNSCCLNSKPRPLFKDAGIEQDIRDAFQATLDAFGSVDIVVPIAGFGGTHDTLGDLKSGRFEGFKKGIEGNLLGVMLLCTLAASHWLKSGTAGVCVITSSASALLGLEFGGHIDGSCAFEFCALESMLLRWLPFTDPTAKVAQLQWVANILATLDGDPDLKGSKSPIRFNAIVPGFVWTQIWKWIAVG